MAGHYRTRDQALAAYLIAKGHEPDGYDVDVQDHRSVWFRFDDSARKDKRGYFDNEPIPCRDFVAGWRATNRLLDVAFGS